MGGRRSSVDFFIALLAKKAFGIKFTYSSFILVNHNICLSALAFGHHLLSPVEDTHYPS
jgi:hypothetical protein